MKLAFVTPWYGNIPGGAESECRRTVENLQKHGIEVEILTTCVKEFLSDWSTDFYEEGIYNLNGVSIHRFSVRKRDTAHFDQINYKLMRGLEISPEEEKTFMREMVNSPNLYSYIAEHGKIIPEGLKPYYIINAKEDYTCFIFFYLSLLYCLLRPFISKTCIRQVNI